MKHLLHGIVGVLFTVIIIASITVVAQRSERENEIRVALPDAAKSALETTTIDGKYKIDDNEKLVAVFTKNLSDNLNAGLDNDYDKNFKVEVKIKSADFKKGLLSVEATEYYTKLNGKIGSYRAETTVVMDKSKEAEKENLREKAETVFKFNDDTVVFVGSRDVAIENAISKLDPKADKEKIKSLQNDSLQKLMKKANEAVSRYSVVTNLDTGEKFYIPTNKVQEYTSKHMRPNGFSVKQYVNNVEWIKDKNNKDVYVFKGTEDDPVEEKEYKITFNANGGKVNNKDKDTITVTESENSISLPDAKKDKCKFIGWFYKDGTPLNKQPNGDALNKAGSDYVVLKDEEVFAKYEGLTYQIQYDLDGGVANNKTSYNTLEPDFTLNNPTKEGHSFLGWTGSNGDKPETTVTVKTSLGGKRIYKANWSEREYNLTVKLNGGTGEYPTKIKKSDEIVLTPPTKKGYEFDGWKYNNTIVKDLTLSNINQDIVVEATWKDDGMRYIECDYGNGEKRSLNIVAGTSFVLPKVDNKNMYLEGVYNGSTKIEGTEFTPTEKYSKLVWKWTAGTFKVNYISTVDNKKITMTYKTGDKIVLPSQQLTGVEGALTENVVPFSKDGYVLEKWNTKPDESGKEFYSGQSVTQNELGVAPGKELNLYTIWNKNAFKLTIDKNGGTGTMPDSLVIIYGKIYSLGEIEKPGCKFLGWEVVTGEDTGTVIDNVFYSKKSDCTIKAKWEVLEYDITYDLAGGSWFTQNRTGKTYSGPTKHKVGTETKINGTGMWKPQKSGYTFAGWTGTNLKEPTLNVTIDANYAGNIKLTANWVKDNYKSTSMDYNTYSSAPFAVWDNTYLRISVGDLPSDDGTNTRSGASFRFPTTCETNVAWDWRDGKYFKNYWNSDVADNRYGYTDKTGINPSSAYRTDTYIYWGRNYTGTQQGISRFRYYPKITIVYYSPNGSRYLATKNVGYQYWIKPREESGKTLIGICGNSYKNEINYSYDQRVGYEDWNAIGTDSYYVRIREGISSTPEHPWILSPSGSNTVSLYPIYVNTNGTIK